MNITIITNGVDPDFDVNLATLFEGRAVAITLRSGDIVYLRIKGIWLDETLLAYVRRNSLPMEHCVSLIGHDTGLRDQFVPLADIAEIEVCA